MTVEEASSGMNTDLAITRRSLVIGLGLTGLPLASGVSAQSSACLVPSDTADGWRVAAPEAAGLDSRQLCSLTAWLDGLRGSNIHSVLVARRGMLGFEHYRKGGDYAWGDSLPDAVHGPTSLHDMRSISKSVTSLLVGIAVDRKLVPSINEPVFKYFPEYVDLRTLARDRITIRHLLTMSAGLEWNENLPYTNPNNSEVAMLRSPDRWRFALEPRVVDEPGSNWNYSGGCTELLGAILRKATGQPFETFAQHTLLTPLGILDATWFRYPDGLPAAASGLRLRSRDLAKIGQLVLQRGQWNDEQVVSTQWIDESTSPQIGPADRIYFYGYQWWLGRSLINQREIMWFFASGLGGQRLFVVPAFDLICVITAGHYTEAMQNWVPLVIFNRYVLPAML
jgi:CubicO group peptidase (beta-lactamase class C family)